MMRHTWEDDILLYGKDFWEKDLAWESFFIFFNKPMSPILVRRYEQRFQESLS